MPGYSGDRSGGSQFEARMGIIVCETLSKKNSSQKRTGGVAQGVGPEFKPKYLNKKRKENC
jgi:hypothetical protein